MSGAGWYPDPSGGDGLRYWNGEAWTRETAARVVDQLSPRDIATGVAVTIISTAAWLVVMGTSTHSMDPFKSPIYSLTWVAGIASVAVASALNGRGTRPAAWAACSLIPGVLALALAGTVFHDPDDGASLWLAGAFFVVIQGGVAWAVGAVTSQCRYRKP